MLMTTMSWKLMFVFMFVMDLVYGQTLTVGSCPSVAVKTDFDLVRYAGTWYENRKNRKYYFIMDSGLKCATETYTVEGDTIKMLNKGLRVLNGRTYEAEGIGKMQSPGKFTFTFEGIPFNPKDVPMWVLDTDYDSYSVVWSCSDRARMNAQITWILTRDPKPDPSVVRKAMDVLDRNGLARSSLIPTGQDNCKYP